MSSLRCIVSCLFCFGMLFAEDLTCIYVDENTVVLSDNSSWVLPEEDGASFTRGEVVSIEASEDGLVTYLVSENQTVVAEFDETIPFENRQIRQVFPLRWNCAVTVNDEVSEGGGPVSMLHMEEGDVMVFFSRDSLLQMEENGLMLLPSIDESGKFSAGDSFSMAQDKDDKIWGVIHPVTGEVFVGLRYGLTSDCTRRVFSHIEGDFLCFEDGSKIDFSAREIPGNDLKLPEGMVVECVKRKISPVAAKMILSSPLMAVSIDAKGDNGLEVILDVNVKNPSEPEVRAAVWNPSSEENSTPVEEGDLDRIVFTLKGPQECADFFGMGVFEKGDVFNIYSFMLDKETLGAALEGNMAFDEVNQLVDTTACYFFERVSQE